MAANAVPFVAGTISNPAKLARAVLVVDDDEGLRDYYCKCPRQAGFEVEGGGRWCSSDRGAGDARAAGYR